MKLIESLRQILGVRGAIAAAAAVSVAGAGAGIGWWQRSAVDPALVATVTRGTLTAQLTTSGTLRPIESLTYRSPLTGRDAEIIDLAPEGLRVNEGDLLVRLDTTELQRDVERLQTELRQLQIDVQVAEGERQEAQAALRAVSEGEGALTVEEVRTRFQLAQKKVDRLRQELREAGAGCAEVQERLRTREQEVRQRAAEAFAQRFGWEPARVQVALDQALADVGRRWALERMLLHIGRGGDPFGRGFQDESRPFDPNP